MSAKHRAGLEWSPEKQLAESFVKGANAGVAGHPAAGVVAMILFADRVGFGPAFAWFVGLLLATLVRVGLAARARRKPEDRILEARRLVRLGVALVAAAWGAGGLLFSALIPSEELGILLVILAGLVAAATATLEADRPAFYAFSTLLLGSLLAGVSLRGYDELNLLLIALVLAFWVVMSSLHRRSHREFAESLRIRHELHAAREQYEGLVESARDLVWRVDEEGRWTFLNRAAEAIYGLPPERLLGTVALDRADEEHREKDYEAFAAVLGGEELVEHETVHLTADGQPRHLSFSARPLLAPDGKVRGAQGTARDVTDQVRAREALEEVARKNSLVRSLINGTEDLIFYKDADGVYQGCNHRFADFLGYPEEEIVGRTDAELTDPERAEAYRKSDVEALTSWDPVRFEEWVVDAQGRRRLLETVKTVFRVADGEALGILGVVRDVTERKEAEERMRALAEEAERATRMKSAFLANMSHEIRTPMNGVMGMTELLLATELTEEQRQALEVIRSSGEALLGVLNDILDISKIEAGHLELEVVSFDLHDTVLGAAHVFSHAAVEQGSELIVDLRPGVPRGVQGDPVRLRQVLSNLIGNAVKFTRDGEIVVTVEVEGENAAAASGPSEAGPGSTERGPSDLGEPSGGSRTGEAVARPEALPPNQESVSRPEALPPNQESVSLRFSVRDTGVGVPEEKRQAIFEEFAQADSSTTRQYGGTGLGLTISRRLVALMGGELGLESAVGVGSEFHFTLTLPVDPAFRPESAPEAPVDLTGRRILVVDDLEANRRIFRGFLESAGAEVRVAADAAEGLRVLRAAVRTTPFDAALLDLLMPMRDGFQLAEDIRLDRELRDLPLLVLTSSNRPGDRRLARRLHVEGFLHKPVGREELLRGVEAVLRGPERDRQAAAGEEGRRPAAHPGGVPKEEQPLAGARILVAEDNLVNQKVALGLLEKWGAQVVLAANGQEALDRLAEASPDLVLMDIQMPEMDGVEATRRIREDPALSRLPVLALTAHVLPEERARCEQAGMNDYVPKPFRPAELLETLLRWLPAGAPAAPPREPPVLLESFRAAMREAGIESVVEAAIAAYLQETPGRLAALDEAAEKEDWDEVARQAHALKSGSRNLRADAFGNLLEEVEHAGRRGQGEQVLRSLPRLRAAAEEVLGYLNDQGYGVE